MIGIFETKGYIKKNNNTFSCPYVDPQFMLRRYLDKVDSVV